MREQRALKLGTAEERRTVVGQRPRDAPANPAVYDHGITQGASDALDAQTLWIFNAVRALNQPQPGNPSALDPGRQVFANNCASCHGGLKWTKSQIFHRDNPAAKGQNIGASRLGRPEASDYDSPGA
jgi:mono/diheme cytochrome c family protein